MVWPTVNRSLGVRGFGGVGVATAPACSRLWNGRSPAPCEGCGRPVNYSANLRFRLHVTCGDAACRRAVPATPSPLKLDRNDGTSASASAVSSSSRHAPTSAIARQPASRGPTDSGAWLRRSLPPPRRPEPRQEPPRLCGDFAALHYQGVVPVIEVREMLVHPYPDRDLPHAARIRYRPRRPSREQPICQRRLQPDPLPDLKLLHLAAPATPP